MTLLTRFVLAALWSCTAQACSGLPTINPLASGDRLRTGAVTLMEPAATVGAPAEDLGYVQVEVRRKHSQ